MSVDGINGRIAQYEPLMTGAYRDSLKKTPAFSMDSVVPPATTQKPDPAPATPAPTTVARQTLASSSNLRQLFDHAEATPQPQPQPQPAADTDFVPTFRSATGSAPGWGTWSLNQNYFATQETAQWIANKYGTGEVVETPFGGSGGIFSASQNELQIKLQDGRLVNAGVLAAYYERNPPDKFPGLADKLIRSALGV